MTAIPGSPIHTVETSEAIRFLSTKPTMIITTCHDSGIVNAGVFGAYTNLSSSQIGVATATTSDTYANIVRAGEFVINVPGADLVKSLAILAKSIPPDRSELDDAGLSTREGITMSVPSIRECVAAVELTLEKEVPIARHHFMIGRVTGGWIRQDCLDPDGRLNVFKARVLRDFKYPEPLYMTPGAVVNG